METPREEDKEEEEDSVLMQHLETPGAENLDRHVGGGGECKPQLRL